MLRVAVVDKTGLTGRYDIKFSYDENKPETIVDGLRGLGLTVTAGKITTDLLVLGRP